MSSGSEAFLWLTDGNPLDPNIRCSFNQDTEPLHKGGQHYSVKAKATSSAQDSGQKYLLT